MTPPESAHWRSRWLGRAPGEVLCRGSASWRQFRAANEERTTACRARRSAEPVSLRWLPDACPFLPFALPLVAPSPCRARASAHGLEHTPRREPTATVPVGDRSDCDRARLVRQPLLHRVIHSSADGEFARSESSCVLQRDKRPISSVRWRSLRLATVFDGLIRQRASRRATRAGPCLGRASRRS